MNLAAISAQQYQLRKQACIAAIAARRITTSQAEARLRPWLAIAAICGADLEELRVGNAPVYPQGRTGAPPTTSARAPYTDFASRENALEALTRARDAALDRDMRDDATRGLVALARHLHCRPYIPGSAGASGAVPGSPEAVRKRERAPAGQAESPANGCERPAFEGVTKS